jgi:death-on-curing protein
MKEPKWITVDMILAIHDEALAAAGGAPGLREAGLLDSAAHRAQQRFHYESKASIFDLAATCCAGIVKNHPFIDANKRTGLLTARAFLFLNGYLLEPGEAEEVEVLVALASGKIDEAFLARWFADNSTRQARRRR